MKSDIGFFNKFIKMLSELPDDFDCKNLADERIELISGLLNQGQMWEDDWKILQACISGFSDEQLQKMSELKQIGYKIKAFDVQNTQDFLIKAERMELDRAYWDNDHDIDFSFDSFVYLTYLFNSDGTTSIVRDEKTYDDPANTEEHLSLSKGQNSEYYEKYSKEDYKFALLLDIEVVSGDNGPEYVDVTKKSDILDGAYDICRYDFPDYPEDYDVMQAIEDGTIEGGKKIAGVVKTSDDIVMEEDYKQGDFKTERKYAQKTDGSKIDYSFKISENGKNLLNLERSFEKNPDGSTTTVVNGKTYTVSFDDNSKSYTIINDEGNKQTYPVLEQLTTEYVENADADIERFFEFLKDVPADILIKLGDIWQIKVIENKNESSINHTISRLEAACDLTTLAHELGHMECGNKALLKLPELVQTYNEEMKNFREKYPETKNDIIEYLSSISDAKTSGLSEFIADVHMLCTTYNFDDHLADRAHYLVKYFPKTLAMVADKLGYNNPI